eukprot:CAMPEP_0170495966 /NCGR_PEP_ID=MMETSP0208-20121228/19491_1 /TAXON_ID=197538 /ORGANISM="Strombidium inclinatum, Strain S3" /LENGTH=160 /DNA_ID=CAMNT_0010772383 /DNA_START=2065 /DNA_END=2549 /DNA_ORIENTATION=-
MQVQEHVPVSDVRYQGEEMPFQLTEVGESGVTHYGGEESELSSLRGPAPFYPREEPEDEDAMWKSKTIEADVSKPVANAAPAQILSIQKQSSAARRKISSRIFTVERARSRVSSHSCPLPTSRSSGQKEKKLSSSEAPTSQNLKDKEVTNGSAPAAKPQT